MVEGSSPDELYTLRAQFALGHYRAALTEAIQVGRRPMASNLKLEREEYVRRIYIALHQYDQCTTQPGEGPGLQALALQAQYNAGVAAQKDEASQRHIVDALKTLAGTGEPGSTALLAAAQVCLDAGDTAAAYQFAAGGNNNDSTVSSTELLACKIQILLRLDRLDLAQRELAALQRVAEESVLSELCQVYVALATGTSMANDAEHSINSLSEQYGPSILLSNLLAVALAMQGDYSNAESKLLECLRDLHDEQPVQHETLCNLIAIQTQMGKMNEASATLDQLVQSSPPSSCSIQYTTSLQRVTTAFDREALKYKV